MPHTHPSDAFYLEFDPAADQTAALECAFILRDRGKFSRISQTEFASHLTTVRFAYEAHACSGQPEIMVTPPGTAPRQRMAPDNGWVFGAKFRCCIGEALQAIAADDLTKIKQKHMKLMKAGLSFSELETEFRAATRNLCDLLNLEHQGSVQSDRLRSDRPMSRRTERRRFQALTGLAPKRHDTLSRFHRALTELAKNDQSLSDIAYGCDYSDQPHFSRDFRKMSGKTPQQFTNL